MNYLITAAATIIICAIKILQDWYTVEERKKRINKPFSVFYQYSLIGALLYYLYPDKPPLDLFLTHYFHLIMLYWLFYDLGLNKSRGFYWARVPRTTSECVTLSDELMVAGKFKKYENIVFKLALISLSGFIYFRLISIYA